MRWSLITYGFNAQVSTYFWPWSILVCLAAASPPPSQALSVISIGFSAAMFANLVWCDGGEEACWRRRPPPTITPPPLACSSTARRGIFIWPRISSCRPLALKEMSQANSSAWRAHTFRIGITPEVHSQGDCFSISEWLDLGFVCLSCPGTHFALFF